LVSQWQAVPAGLSAVDIAAGYGRHARALADRFDVLAVDRDQTALDSLENIERLRTVCMDLEGSDWPLMGQHFDLVVVSNYFWRPRLQELFALVSPGGLLLYETFSAGNAAYGKPSNPAFLVEENELLKSLPADFAVVHHWQGFTDDPAPAMRVRLAAKRQV